jgi:hypothetical protein
MVDERNCSSRVRRAAFASCLAFAVDGFSISRIAFIPTRDKTLVKSPQFRSTLSMIYAPPGSGYATPEDEKSELPDSYEPMMEFPGTMRPGRTPENMPFHDLPLADTDPDPVPWPHFQQIEWHHRWEPPHPHPIPMEEFIEQVGRWATPEMEAAMRAGNRRDTRRRLEIEEEQKRDNLIMDDDDDDPDVPQDLGEGMFGRLGSAADQAITSAAVAAEGDINFDVVDDEDDESLGDFLLDLGLDSFDDDDEQAEDIGQDSKPAIKKVWTSGQRTGLEDVVIGGEDEDEGVEDDTINTDVTASIDVDEDDDMDLALDDEEDLSSDGVSTVPLEDFGDNDNIDTQDFFDDGGFDYDDGDYGGGDSDNW